METPGAAQLAAGKQPASCAGLLELRGVGYRYPTRPDPPALQGINLTIRPGQLTAIVGLSGSGKSTLMALLQRLYDPCEGELLLDGEPLSALDAGWYRRQIGVVSQEPKLFSTTIAANIGYGVDGPPLPQCSLATRLTIS